VSLGLAWALPELFADARLRWARRAVGVLLLLIAAVVVFQAVTS
jgi:hypothetical protein